MRAFASGRNHQPASPARREARPRRPAHVALPARNAHRLAAFTDGLPLQRVKITVAYEPQNPGFVKPREVETGTFAFDELVDIFISAKNDAQDLSALAIELLKPENYPKWLNILHLDPGAVKKADTRFKKLGHAGALLAIARTYLTEVEEALNPQAVFAASNLLPKDEQSRHGGKKGEAIATDKREREEEAQRQILQSVARARKFMSIATSFATEIPDEFADERMRFLLLLAKTAQAMGLHDDPPHAIKNLGQFLAPICSEAATVVKRLLAKKPGAIPTTFEQALAPEYQHVIAGMRKRVEAILRPYATLIADIIPGAVLKYRGSLTDGIKNYTKSAKVQVVSLEPPEIDFGKKALSVNIAAFDVDAFVEIPQSLWDHWSKFGLIPDPKFQAIKGKVMLRDWVKMLARLAERSPSAETRFAAAFVLNDAQTLLSIEQAAAAEMRQIAGYKFDPQTDKAEFETALQPTSKTKKSIEYGKPYPLGELSLGGSAYQELLSTFAVLREEGVNEDAAWIAETHQTIRPLGTVSSAQSALASPLRGLRSLDLSGIKDVPPETIEMLVTAIENGELPFLAELKANVDAINAKQRARIWNALPVRISLTGDQSLNF